MNVACFIGKLTADPVVNMTPKGTKTCSFSIAVNRKHKNADGIYPVDYIRCVAWRNTAVFIESYFKKGKHIGINGSVQTRTYEEKNTGKTITVYEVIVNNAYFCSDKAEGTGVNADINNDAEDIQEIDNKSLLSEFEGCDDPISDDGDLPF